MEEKQLNRPRHKKGEKWYNTQSLEYAIDRYFKACEKRKTLPTSIGLATELGMLERTFLRWASGEGSTKITGADIKKEVNRKKRKRKLVLFALQRIETKWQERLNENGATGAIFQLKNKHGYTDARELSTHTTQEHIFNEEQLNRIIKRKNKELEAPKSIQGYEPIAHDVKEVNYKEVSKEKE